jgi:hypothetical protein
MTLGEILRRMGDHTMPQDRVVPACADRAYTGRSSASAVPHAGRGGRARTRHGNGRCGSTTMTPEEILRRMGDHTIMSFSCKDEVLGIAG